MKKQLVPLVVGLLVVSARGADSPTTLPQGPNQADFEKGFAALEKRDGATAMPLLMKAAEAGHRRATYGVGLVHMMEGRIDDAIPWLTRASNLGEAAADRVLGFIYVTLKEDPKQGLAALKRGAERGDKPSMGQASLLYILGGEIPVDYPQALQLARNAVAGGDEPNACSALGLCYLNGWGIEKDQKAAVDWFRRGAVLNSATCMRQLGEAYAEGLTVAKSDEQAAAWYRRASHKGDGMALYRLAICYRDGRGVTKRIVGGLTMLLEAERKNVAAAREALAVILQRPEDFPLGAPDDTSPDAGITKEKSALVRGYIAFHRQQYADAIPLVTRAAEAGNSAAMFMLYKMYTDGQGVAKDPITGLMWLEKAVELDQSNAVLEMADRYATAPQTRGKAVELLMAAANRGVYGARSKLGMILIGNGPAPANLEAGRGWLGRGANAGEPSGQYNLGISLARGEGGKTDYVEAVRWLGQSFLGGDDQGLASAEKVIAVVAQSEEGGDRAKAVAPGLRAMLATSLRDDVRAFALWEKEAEAGNTHAQHAVAECLEAGRGITADPEKAVAWYRKAAEGGNASSMSRLGYLYMQGMGVPADHREAFAWNLRGAEAGDINGMFNVGVLYATGDGVAADKKEAFAWFMKAANEGHKEAMFNVAAAMLTGKDLPKDEAAAVNWMRSAAWGGSAKGMYNFGVLLMNGIGVDKDVKAALYWFQQAGRAGDADAMRAAGAMLINGDAGQKDPAAGRAWLQKAADAGNEKAREALRSMGP